MSAFETTGEQADRISGHADRSRCAGQTHRSQPDQLRISRRHRLTHPRRSPAEADLLHIEEEMMTEHERIWLEPSPGADEDYGRQWCQHNVWDKGVEYIKADLVAKALPFDPTDEMVNAALAVDWECDGDERAAAINVWHAMSAASNRRLPYDIRLQIGKALDRLICEDSTPEQVDKFIETFGEFGLTIVANAAP